GAGEGSGYRRWVGPWGGRGRSGGRGGRAAARRSARGLLVVEHARVLDARHWPVELPEVLHRLLDVAEQKPPHVMAEPVADNDPDHVHLLEALWEGIRGHEPAALA